MSSGFVDEATVSTEHSEVMKGSRTSENFFLDLSVMASGASSDCSSVVESSWFSVLVSLMDIVWAAVLSLSGFRFFILYTNLAGSLLEKRAIAVSSDMSRSSLLRSIVSESELKSYSSRNFDIFWCWTIGFLNRCGNSRSLMARNLWLEEVSATLFIVMSPRAGLGASIARTSLKIFLAGTGFLFDFAIFGSL